MALNWNIKTFFTKHIKLEDYINNIPNISIIKMIQHYSDRYNVPFYVLLGIFIIETTNRTILLRFIEYLATAVYGLLSLLFKIEMKNYTVGVCQVGIGNILYLSFNRDNRYDRYLNINNFNEFKSVFNGFKKTSSIKFAAKIIKDFIDESSNLNPERQIRYIGQKYNGKVEYGILLCKLVQALEKNIMNGALYG